MTIALDDLFISTQSRVMIQLSQVINRSIEPECLRLRCHYLLPIVDGIRVSVSEESG